MWLRVCNAQRPIPSHSRVQAGGSTAAWGSPSARQQHTPRDYQLLWCQVSAFQQAAFCYEELLMHEPAKMAHHLLYAECQYSLHSWRTARTYYSSALQLTGGKHPRALYGIAACTAQLAGQKVSPTSLPRSSRLNSTLWKDTLCKWRDILNRSSHRYRLGTGHPVPPLINSRVGGPGWANGSHPRGRAGRLKHTRAFHGA